MDTKKKLIKFVKLKNKIIIKSTGIKYADEKDIIDIKNWEDSICKLTYETLSSNICNGADGLSTFTCIWCLKHNRDCNCCKYGYRHGKCYEDNSLFLRYNFIEEDKMLSNNVYKNIIYLCNK